MLTRRSFLGWLASAVPATVVVRRAHAAALTEWQRGPATLGALGAAILPGELGANGITAEVLTFQRWITGYRENAEVNHAYGSSRLATTGPTPATRWMQQLDDLEARARSTHGKPFPSLTIDERRAIVRQALPAGNAGLTNVAGAAHVALALLAHFYSGSRATDLCYEATIGKQTCRPLARSTAKPVALRRASLVPRPSSLVPPQ